MFKYIREGMRTDEQDIEQIYDEADHCWRHENDLLPTDNPIKTVDIVRKTNIPTNRLTTPPTLFQQYTDTPSDPPPLPPKAPPPLPPKAAAPKSIQHQRFYNAWKNGEVHYPGIDHTKICRIEDGETYSTAIIISEQLGELWHHSAIVDQLVSLDTGTAIVDQLMPPSLLEVA